MQPKTDAEKHCPKRFPGRSAQDTAGKWHSSPSYTHSANRSASQTAAVGDYLQPKTIFNTGSKKTAGQGSLPVQPMLFTPDSRLGQIRVRILRASAGGGIAWGRIRSPAGEPRRLKQSTELFPRAGFPISSSKTKKKRVNQMIYSLLVGEDGFEPSKRNAADLQSVPFGHSGTPPDMKFCFV